jgi:hypothetical protein
VIDGLAITEPALDLPLTRAARARLDAHWAEVDATEHHPDPALLVERAAQLEADVVETYRLETAHRRPTGACP